MHSRRLLTLSPDNEPLWVRLYVHQIGEKWAAMIVDDGAAPPEPGTLKGLAFFGATPDEAEQAAKVYLGTRNRRTDHETQAFLLVESERVHSPRLAAKVFRIGF